VIELDEGRLDDLEAVDAGDPQGMLRAIAGSGAQIRAALGLAADAGVERVAEEGRPRAIVVVGMGGSGISGDVLAALAGLESPIPILVHRGHGLPGWVGAADLVMAVSCSGSTEETLSATEEAVRRGARLLGVGAPGSPLADLVARGRGPFVPVVGPGQPRAALWLLSTPLLVAGHALGLVPDGKAELESAADLLDAIAERCRPASESFLNPAKTIALSLAGTVPVVWGSSPLAATAAYRFVCQLNENAKHPGIAGSLPETAHNQVMALDGAFGRAASDADIFADPDDPAGHPTRLHLVMLKDPGEHPKVAVRRVAATAVAEERGVRVTELEAEGSSATERFASLVATADFATTYLALALGIDPTPVGAITELKARAAERS
jgi:glucose/mannose-6-phosphate isomerase